MSVPCASGGRPVEETITATIEGSSDQANQRNERRSSEQPPEGNQQSNTAQKQETNEPATGSPSIQGTLQVGETLTANTKNVSDADGLTARVFTHQWRAAGFDVQGSTSATYTLTASNEGATIQVRVYFTDDLGNPETRTSEPYGPVAAQPEDTQPPAPEPAQSQEPEAPAQETAPEPPNEPTNLQATVNPDGSVTLTWNAPDDDTVTGYLVLRRRPQMDEDTLMVYVEDTGSTATTYTDTDTTPGTRHLYRGKAVNSAGAGERSNVVRATP